MRVDFSQHMKTKYIDLIEQTFDWPVQPFTLVDGNVHWRGIDMSGLAQRYGTPLRFHYLPVIGKNIARAKGWFQDAMRDLNYGGNYEYCYVTKSSHFSFVLEEVLKSGVNLESSSAFDLDIIRNLEQRGKIQRDHRVICNGFKQTPYLKAIAGLIKDGFTGVLPVLDNRREAGQLAALLDRTVDVGLRIASEEEPKFEFYTSRLGIRYKDIPEFYHGHIATHPNLRLKMLHFFVNTGIRDSAYYWNELNKCLNVYVELKRTCPSLDSLNIGGGFPIQTSLGFEFDYAFTVREILSQVQAFCREAGVEEPHIFTEFGSFTVGESGGMLYSVLHQKQQNDREKWNFIDSSFMTTLPDSWAISKRFLMLPLNRWDQEYERTFLGGVTCDSDDYYNSEQHINAIYMPKFDPEEQQFIGYFHTGAYQENLSGYGGISHCLIPRPNHVLLDRDEHGQLTERIFKPAQKAPEALAILGYPEA